MATDDDIAQLTAALHRKLCNFSEDIRKASRQPANVRDVLLLRQLKKTRTQVDKAYSACLNNRKESDPVKRDATHQDLLRQYQQL